MDRLIFNPNSDGGRAAGRLPEIRRRLEHLGIAVELQQTTAPGEALALARQAALAGARRVIAAGGDGTCYEVANGLMAAAAEGYQARLGLIPVGSGNDWADSLGIPADIEQACLILKNGSAWTIDLGRVVVDGESHFFVNNVGLGLDAEATIISTKLKLLRGFLRYLGAALWVVAFGRWPYQASFSMDGQQQEEVITLFNIGNGARSGGGFYLTPQAQLDDGFLDVCYASRLSIGAVLKLLPKTLKGTHVGHQAVTMSRSKRIELVVKKGIPGHVDGEILCENGRTFQFEILPQALTVWV